jgi:arylsulfatase A-like enzyme
VLILVDTLRKDGLHLYGNERRTSDAIDALAEEGWVFDHHIASASQTVPSMLSLMLSRHPADHGFADKSRGHFIKNPPFYSEDFVFLAEVFQKAGYTNGGFVTNPYLGTRSRFDQGFEKYVHGRRPGSAVTFGALEWVSDVVRERREPFFLYVHYMDVHHPVAPPAPFRDRFPLPAGGRRVYADWLVPKLRPIDLEFTRTLYDAAISFIDSQVEALVEQLDALGVRDDTLFVFTSDHGDEFFDHGGLGHGTTVYGELVRVPLVVVYPRRLEPGRRIAHLTRHVDLAPTLLRWAGVPVPPEFQGGSLLEPATRAFVENGPWEGVYAEGRKLILNRATGEHFLFDLGDELDQTPTAREPEDELLWQHLGEYGELRNEHEAVPRGEAWDREELEELRALGYME